MKPFFKSPHALFPGKKQVSRRCLVGCTHFRAEFQTFSVLGVPGGPVVLSGEGFDPGRGLLVLFRVAVGCGC